MADAQDKMASKPQSREPAKGGTKSASPKTHPSGDSPKPHGDTLKHVISDKK